MTSSGPTTFTVMLAIVAYVLVDLAWSAHHTLGLIAGLAFALILIIYIVGLGGYRDMWKRFVETVKQMDNWIDGICLYLREN